MTQPSAPETYLTFDDVLLLPAFSKVLPSEVDVATQLTKTIRLNCPLASAPMDTVTEAGLAIAMAQEGGIGIIHRNLPPETQRKMVERVKRSVSIIINDPITLDPDQTLGDARQVMDKYRITGIPITKGKKLVGILTNRDIRFETKFFKKISDLMTQENLVTIRVNTSLDKAKKMLHDNRIEKLPVVDRRGNLKGLLTLKDILKSTEYPNAAKDDSGRLRVGAALGVSTNTMQHIEAMAQVGLDVLVIDSAHGHTEKVLTTIREIKKTFPDLQVVGGNVATGEGTLALIKAGVDAVKVGIGPGSICTTRVVTGVGVPQVTAVQKCAAAAAK
ncbi:MAG: IMP dehydrogenase, partial [Nitrospinaceae bacterium]